VALDAKYSDLREFVSCSICLEEFQNRDPRSLSCLHAFCSKCIQTMLQVARKANSSLTNTICCPVCNTSVQIPEGSTKNLPAFFYYNKVQTVINSMEKKCMICKTCQINSISNYCFRCTTGMCIDCKDKHDAKYLNHPQMDVDRDTMKYIMCEKHEQQIEAFCIT
ncbi:hypothetical protein LSH36_627g00000, partial [Paralvinella palmiformis]